MSEIGLMLEGIMVIDIFKLICLVGILVILAARTDRKDK